jgi:hypothetical protein
MKILLHPADPNHIYALTWENLYESLDAGQTWSVLFANPAVASPEHNGDFSDIEFLPGNPNILFVSTKHISPWMGRTSKIWVSTNAGTGWLDLTPPSFHFPSFPLASDAITLAVTPDAPNTIFASVKEFQPGGNLQYNLIVKSSDNGATWMLATAPDSASPLGFGRSHPLFEINQSDEDVMYGGFQLSLDKSVDGGRTLASNFSKSTGHDDNRVLQILQSTPGGGGDHLIVGNDGGVSRSTDGGASWTNLNGSDLLVTQFFDIDNSSMQPGLVAGGTQDNGSFVFSNGQWKNPYWGDGGQTVIDWSDPNTIYVRSNPHILKSTDGGGFFQPIMTINLPGYAYSDHDLIQHPQDPDSLYVAKVHQFWTIDGQGNIANSFDFHQIDSVPPLIQAMAVSHSDPDILFISFRKFESTSPRLAKSIDGGLQFTDITSNLNGALLWNQANTIEIDPLDPDRIWLGLSGFDPNRILASTDGGASWNPFVSTGLPELPVNTLKYQHGTDGILFAGTDVGVFRFDPAVGFWECFNNGLPVCIVTDIAFDYCKRLIQIGTFGRGIWESPFSKPAPRHISGDLLWDTGSYIHSAGDIEIDPQARLTLKGTLNMAENTQIIVRPGAELHIDGGLITNLCGDTWKGIFVMGDNVSPQSCTFPNCGQGRIILENQARIEHAADAIMTSDPTASWGFGGIVFAEDASFRNNKRDVAFLKFTNSTGSGQTTKNISYFTRCEFMIDEGYRFPNAKQRVTLWNVDGVTFTACDFTIQNPSFRFSADGIYSIDAGYVIKAECSGQFYTPSTCSPGTPCTFGDFNNGIRATRVAGSHTVIVDASVFTNNLCGIMSESVNDVQITRNQFFIGGGDPLNSYINAGAVIHTGTRYHIYDNDFTGLPLGPHTVGTYVHDTGPEENEIYGNRYSGMYAANLSYGMNRDPLGNASPGLQYLCNAQSEDVFDIAAGWGEGIRYYQGTPPTGLDPNPIAAQNTFSRTGITAESDFYNHSDGFIVAFFDPIIPETEALFFSPNGKVAQVPATNNTCPAKAFANGLHDLNATEAIQLNLEFDQAELDYTNVKFNYLSLIDGGNTPQIVNNVTTQWSGDAWTLRSELLDESPNLSQEVLLEAANTGILPDAMLLEVLLANIASCRDQEFLNILANEIPNPLPEYMIDLVANYQEPASLRQSLEMQIAAEQKRMADAAHILIRDILQDPVFDPDTLAHWYRRLDGWTADFSAAEVMLQNGEVAAAQILVESIQGKPYFREEYLEAHDAWKQLFGLKAQIALDGRNWLQLTPAETDALETLAGGPEGLASVQAHNLLRFAAGHTYDLPLQLPEVEGQGSRLMVRPGVSLADLMIELKVYPNPAKDYALFEYRAAEPLENAFVSIMNTAGSELRILDLPGERGQVVWDVREVPAGVYLFRLMKGAEVLKAGSFVVRK